MFDLKVKNSISSIESKPLEIEDKQYEIESVKVEDNTQLFEIESASPEVQNILDMLSQGLKFDLVGTEFDIYIRYYQEGDKKIIEIKSL